MGNKNSEMMRKFIEEKKKKSAPQGGKNRPEKMLGSSRSAPKQYKKGGLFD
jgi:hypothetical protein